MRDLSDPSTRTKNFITEFQYNNNIKRYPSESFNSKEDSHLSRIKQELAPKNKLNTGIQLHAANMTNQSKSNEKLSEKPKGAGCNRSTVNDPFHYLADKNRKSIDSKSIEQQNIFHGDRRKSVMDKENIGTSNEAIDHARPMNLQGSIYKYVGHIRNSLDVCYDDEVNSSSLNSIAPGMMKSFNDKKYTNQINQSSYDNGKNAYYDSVIDTGKSRSQSHNYSINNGHNKSVYSNMGESTGGESKNKIEEKLKDLEFKLRDVEIRNKGLKVEKSIVEVKLEKLMLDLKEKSESNDPKSEESIMMLQNEVKYLLGVIMDNQNKHNGSTLEYNNKENNANIDNIMAGIASNQPKNKVNLSSAIENFAKNVNINIKPAAKNQVNRNRSSLNIPLPNKSDPNLNRNISNTSQNSCLVKADKNSIPINKTSSDGGSGKLIEIMRQRSANLKEHLNQKVNQSFSDYNNCNIDQNSFMFSSYMQNSSNKTKSVSRK